VQVEVKDRLASDPSVVRKDVKPLQIKRFHERASDDLCRLQNVGETFHWDGQEVGAVDLRNNKGVPEVDGTNVQHREYPVRLIEDFGWLLLLDDFAEGTIHRKR
jgi:hypothetical protein